jgi:hypothetical protein
MTTIRTQHASRGATIALTLGWLALLSTTTLADNAESYARLTEAAREHRSRLDFDGETFSGPAFDQLLAAARDAHFLLIGEEHGIAENPKLVAQLFRTLVPDGYAKLGIEVSPPMAAILDAVLRDDGIEGLRKLYASPGGEPAFFGMREEAELIATARRVLPDATEVLWGLDYEVAGDRPLLRQLRDSRRPAPADEPLNRLIAASDAAWARYEDTGNPQYIFSFSGDPALVGAVSEAWQARDDATRQILDTLQSTLEINQSWVQGRGWESNAQRAELLRSNFLNHWHKARQNGDLPKVVIKLGANHLVRGRNNTATFDLGTLLPEIAAVEGVRSASVLVLPGRESLTAVLNPSTWTFEPKPAKDNYASGIDALTDAAYSDAFTLIDIAALRPVVGTGIDKYGLDVARIVHGFDLLLVLSGSTASSEFEHD